MRRARAIFLVLGALSLGSGASRAEAQGEAPVPSEPTQPAKADPGGEPAKAAAKRRPRRAVPGFETGAEAAGPADEPGDAHPKAADADARPKQRRPRGRSTGLEAEEVDETRPVSVPEQGSNERLIADLNAATGEVSLGELLDEILADVVAELDVRPAKWFSPMAIRTITLGANVTPSFKEKLASLVTAQIHAGTSIRMVQCIECDLVRTRMEDGQWVISHGITSTRELQRVADDLGAKAFMDVAFGFDPATGVVELQFSVIRARDSFVLWSDTFRADETTPLLMRASESPMRRKDRLRDLEMLLEGRPLYGYVATAGFMLLPYNDPVEGDIGGATAGYRIYERFGSERRVMFGLDLTGFLNTSRLSGGLISAGSWWIPLRPDLVSPELRLGAKAGAFVAGSAGNAAVFQLGAEVLLRYRFGLYAYVLFMTKSEFPPDSGKELGGVGMSTGMSFNW